MNIKDTLVGNQLFNSFSLLKRIYFYVAYSVIVDFIFLFLHGFIANTFIAKVEQKAVELLDTGKEILYGGSFIKGILSNNETFSILLYTLLFIVIIFINYCITQGIVWYISRKITGKAKLFRYMKKFFLVNLFWGVLFFIIQFIDYFRNLFFSLSGNRLLGYGLIPISINILIVVLLYFAFISYVLIGKHKVMKSIVKSFWIGIRRIKDVLSMYLVVLLVFLVINGILVLFGKVNDKLMLISGAILILPALLWARVFIDLVVSRLDRK